MCSRICQIGEKLHFFFHSVSNWGILLSSGVSTCAVQLTFGSYIISEHVGGE
jgi:hypothetical protein